MADYLKRARQLLIRHLCAIGQTFFVSNPWTGLAGIAILAVASPRLALAGFFLSVLARSTAERLRAAKTLLDTGIIELNGWFLGLACASYFDVGPGLVVAVLIGGPLVATFAIVLQRVLATWDVPLILGPYLPAFWLLWSALSRLPWVHGTALPLMPPPESGILLVLLGGLRGVGQIFFLPDARAGVAIALAASIADWRIGPVMIAASVASVGIGYLAAVPLWQTELGLAGFTPALVAAAAFSRFAGLGPVAVGVAVIAGPLLEIAAIRLAGAAGLYALSAPYVGFVWLFALLRPVRQAADARSAWSMRVQPLLIETGGSPHAAAADSHDRTVRRVGRWTAIAGFRGIAPLDDKSASD
jgi:urea transporter